MENFDSYQEYMKNNPDQTMIPVKKDDLKFMIDLIITMVDNNDGCYGCKYSKIYPNMEMKCTNEEVAEGKNCLSCVFNHSLFHKMFSIDLDKLKKRYRIEE